MRVRGIHLVAAIAAAAGLALTSCGGDDAAESGDLAALVPPDVPLYAEVVIRPDDDQADAIKSLTERVAGIEDPGQALVDEINHSLADAPGEFSYEDDIEPWLGDRGAFFVRSFEGNDGQPDAAAMVQVTDTGAAQDLIDKLTEEDPEQAKEPRSYHGAGYTVSTDGQTAIGLIDDMLVVGTEDSFKVAVDAANGESLAGSDEYTQRIAPLGDDALATFYLEPGAAIEAAIKTGDIDPEAARLADPLLDGALSDPVTIGVSAGEDSATVDFVATTDGEHPVATDSALLEGLPAGSWLAIGASDLGPAVDRWLDGLTRSGIPGAAMLERRIRAETGIDVRRDVTPWLGDAAAFIKGTDAEGLSLGMIAETSDPAGPRRLIDTVQALAQSDSGTRSHGPPEGADYGFTFPSPLGSAGLEVGVAEGKLVAALATSVQGVLHPDETLGDDDGFRTAADQLGDDFSPSLYLDIPQGLVVAERGAGADSPDYDTASPYVDKLDALVAGARVDGDLFLGRLIVTLAQ